MTALRFALISQVLCGALVLIGFLVAAFMSDREAAGMVIALQIVLPLVVVVPLGAIASIRVLMRGENRDRIRLATWYTLIVAAAFLFVFLDVVNQPAFALVSLPVAAATLILPAIWLRNS